jgi:hypothetical protein
MRATVQRPPRVRRQMARRLLTARRRAWTRPRGRVVRAMCRTASSRSTASSASIRWGPVHAMHRQRRLLDNARRWRDAPVLPTFRLLPSRARRRLPRAHRRSKARQSRLHLVSFPASSSASALSAPLRLARRASLRATVRLTTLLPPTASRPVPQRRRLDRLRPARRPASARTASRRARASRATSSSSAAARTAETTRCCRRPSTRRRRI